MNAVEIEEAISSLAEQDFDAESFPYAFLEAFGNKPTTIKRLKTGSSNASDIEGGVLQRNNIHLAVCPVGETTEMLAKLKASPATQKAKAKFALATDGQYLEAEDLLSGETVACDYKNFPNHFGFFLPLAGISTVQQIRNNPIDIQATGRLNRLYIELLRTNEDWGGDDSRLEMNQFMTRLIFCFFAEDTEIFMGDNLFTATIEQMSDSRSENADFVIAELFRAMDTPRDERKNADLPNWADGFPYVNGGLFAGTGNKQVPKFSRIARTYLLHAGSLDWKAINPDIFGSMIQAVADDEERGELGMHYTSVPNILKVLNPLFLDDLSEQLKQAGDNQRKLLNLKKRMAKIRVFDPACGSGNFLVIAYKNMREIEYKIHQQRNEIHLKSDIPLTNFRGIELKSFPAEIARLALIIAEYQCDVLYRGQKDALAEFLPLNAMNWITCGNALRIDWLSVCPPTGTGVKLVSDDLFATPLEQTEIDFENEGGETYICGNPPYVGRKYQSQTQKDDLKSVFLGRCSKTLSLDYVSGWFMKSADYISTVHSECALVCTNSVCQGIQVSLLWPSILDGGIKIFFAHTSFKWANLASHNAGVTVSIVGLSKNRKSAKLYQTETINETKVRVTDNINPYLISGKTVYVTQKTKVPDERTPMQFGNHPYYANSLMLSRAEERKLIEINPEIKQYVHPLYGSREYIQGSPRACIWIKNEELKNAVRIPEIKNRIEDVRKIRLEKKKDKQAQKLVAVPHQFRDRYEATEKLIIVPIVSSENRDYLPVGLLQGNSIVHNKAFALYDAPLWNMALIASRLHWVWIGTVCVRMRTDFSYSNTLGWNTFPVPKLTEKNKADLTKCAEDILLAREIHFPATIADLYKSETMPENLRHAHQLNDEVLERIYIGRRFKNDTERLEKLFDLYTKMTAKSDTSPKAKKKAS